MAVLLCWWVAFIPLASVPMATVLLVAIFSVHWHYGFSSIKLVAITPTGANFGPPGYECDLLYLAWLVALVLGGLGLCRLSVFYQRQRRLRRRGILSFSITQTSVIAMRCRIKMPRRRVR